MLLVASVVALKANRVIDSVVRNSVTMRATVRLLAGCPGTLAWAPLACYPVYYDA